MDLEQDILTLRLPCPFRHTHLKDCPLETRDWEEVLRAYLAFKAQCRSVALKAHERDANKRINGG